MAPSRKKAVRSPSRSGSRAPKSLPVPSVKTLLDPRKVLSDPEWESLRSHYVSRIRQAMDKAISTQITLMDCSDPKIALDASEKVLARGGLPISTDRAPSGPGDAPSVPRGAVMMAFRSFAKRLGVADGALSALDGASRDVEGVVMASGDLSGDVIDYLGGTK